jgi:hypothetical protein
MSAEREVALEWVWITWEVVDNSAEATRSGFALRVVESGAIEAGMEFASIVDASGSGREHHAKNADESLLG